MVIENQIKAICMRDQKILKGINLIKRHPATANDRKMNFETTLVSRALTTLPVGSKVWLNADSLLDYTVLIFSSIQHVFNLFLKK